MNNTNTCNTQCNVYHEKQIYKLCALHALNNLFQSRNEFTKKDLDDICNQKVQHQKSEDKDKMLPPAQVISPLWIAFTFHKLYLCAFLANIDSNFVKVLSPNSIINPHRYLFGLGNYDVNVIMAAVQSKGLKTVWFDKRKNVSVLAVKNIIGFIFNIPLRYHLGFIRLPLYCKHWLTIRKVGQHYLNLDSKLNTPITIGDSEDLVSYLGQELQHADTELLLVVEPGVYESESWMHVARIH